MRFSSARAAACSIGVVLMLISGAVCLAGQAAPSAAPAQTRQTFQPTPEMLAIQAENEKERQREMDLLGIKELRPGADGGNPKAPNAANYDESKADIYPNLPDPLTLNNGKRVTTAKQWWGQRRPQIVELYDENVLGRTPTHLPKVNWEVVSTTREKNGEFDVVTKKLVGHVENSAAPEIKVDIDLELSTPADAKGPVPVIVELGFSKEFMEQMRKRFPQFAQQQQGPTWQQQVLAKGWGYAEYVPASVQPDNAAGLTQGIIGLVNKGQPRSLDDWGVLKAWAWGASKCLDYFETDKAVDAKQVGIEGHSRYGKAALVAMAYDPRFAIGYISSSGEAGAKLYRHIFGEEVGNISAAVSFHWVAGNFLKYDGPLNTGDLPVDAHELIALCAPRPVFISGGATQGDGWVDAKGMFMAAAAAGPVYRLLGKKDMGTATFPPIETPLIDGDIAFRQHSGGHTPAPNWPTFITFASRYLRAPEGGGALPVTSATKAAPVHLTAAEDRERLMHLLGLTDAQMRRPPATDPKSPNATNYDLKSADRYPSLPDPLVMRNGKRVTTEEQWWSKRRPEIVDDYEREILGRAPEHLPAVNWEVVSVTPENWRGIDVITKRLAGHVDNSSYPQIEVKIDMVLFTPARAPGPVPVLMELAFQKDWDRAIARPFAVPPAPGTPGHWGVDGREALERGWGFAVLNPVSFQADSGDGLTEGIIGLMNKGQPRGVNDWGALRAWAWGASRALDCLEMDRAVDARQVGLVGHSRFGKAVLVAMAYDQRFAIAYSSSSGEGGAKLYRHIYGEQMSNLASASLYHWFCGNFLRYGGPLNPGDLPVDNHELIALSAPRPVFIGGGSLDGDGYAETGGDAWADPKGMFLAEVAAGPVYTLLGKKDLGTKEFPPVGTALTDGELAFREHQYGHTPVPNWPAFLEYAGHYLHAPENPAVLARAQSH
ncbi:MAG TPA: hypothetical protein VKB38_05685 [Terracidiphilus sp.]|nr:hypothetical protein [Terracidiphilus sp.]